MADIHDTHLVAGQPVCISFLPLEHSQNCPTRFNKFGVSQVAHIVGPVQVRQLRWHLEREIVSSRIPQDPVHDFRVDISFKDNEDEE